MVHAGIQLVLLASLALQPAQPPSNPMAVPPRIEAFLETCENYRRGAILQLEHTLRGLLNEEPKSAQTKQSILKIEQDLRELKANRQPVVPKLVFPLKVGGIGRLAQATCHVDQVLSEDEMLVRCFFPVQIAAVRRGERRGETVTVPIVFLVRGLATNDTHDGGDIDLGQVFEVVSKQNYKTVDGNAASAWVIHPFDLKKIEPYFRDFVTRHR